MKPHDEKTYWMDLGDEGATDEEVDPGGSRSSDPWSRRSFLKAAGFTAAAGWLTGCGPGPVRKAIPFLVAPEEVVPGKGYFYASTCGGCTAGCGVLVKCRDGRPIKIEGYRGAEGDLDRSHPVSGGGVCPTGQAALLELYDSHRLKGPRIGDREVEWDEVDREVTARLADAATAGSQIVLLTGTITSPTTRERIRQFLGRHAGARHVVHDDRSASALLDAHEKAMGVRAVPRMHFEKADVIVAFDCDFLGTWLSPVEFSRGWAEKRVPRGNPPRMSWHVQVESGLSLTGSKADRRIVVDRDGSQSLLHRIVRDVARRARKRSPVATPVADADLDLHSKEIARRLWDTRGRSLVVSGSNDFDEQLLIAWINDALGNYGQTLDLARPSYQRMGDDKDVLSLLADMEAGRVGVLIIDDVNPVYDRPDGDRFAAAMEKVGTVVSTARLDDETSRSAAVRCPVPHPLESWDDAEPVHGLVTLTQPTIKRLFDSRSLRESLAAWTGDKTEDLTFRKRWWEGRLRKIDGWRDDFERAWNRAVHDGAFEWPKPPLAPKDFDAAALKGLGPAVASKPSGHEFVPYFSIGMLAGAHAQNAWLMELPDPITKTTWDNCALVSPATAEAIGVEDGDIVRLMCGGESDFALELPVRIQPGQHDRVVAVALGYGRLGTDRFADVGPAWIEGEPTTKKGRLIGVRATPLLKLDGVGYVGAARWSGSIEKTGRKVRLALAQVYGSIEVPEHLTPRGGRRRDVVQETTLAALTDGRHGEAEESGHEGSHTANLWSDDFANERPHWGLHIDLNRCTGCAACVVSCQVENNVPVVGRDEVRRRREMHWLRIDRYYSGEADPAGDVEVIHQPMMCHQCDNAPCETVCPVLATVHSEEGLNQQVYNRCVGTRYCANNCPYKVRRFNWFDYPHEDRLQNMALNPDVTVRSRGVMEKCTFCVQRIQEAKAEAKRRGKPIADGEIQPACMQSCPTEAIVFGNTKDEKSAVSRAMKASGSFRVLEELNIRPSVAYGELVRNKDSDDEGKRHG